LPAPGFTEMVFLTISDSRASLLSIFKGGVEEQERSGGKQAARVVSLFGF
jgi:hypothetical protein